MAEQMEDIKRRIKSISSTERITNAMKLVSASKLRKTKAAYTKSQMYLNRIIESMAETLENEEELPRELIFGRKEIKTTCYIVLTSSNGLCGSFNSNVIKTMERNLYNHKGNVKLVTIGSRAKDYFGRRGHEILMDAAAPAESITFEKTRDISKPLSEMYQNGEIDEINVVYTSYVNTLKQEVVTRKLIPLEPSETSAGATYKKQVEYEPSSEDVFNYLIPKYLELVIYSVAIESATCEYAARRSAMETANDNAKDMLDSLQMYYNRARQAEITDEIIEIVAGSEAQR